MIKNILNNRYVNLFYLFLILLFGGNNAFAQCPTVLNNSQTFCNTQSPTVANLVATNNGNGVVWYATASSTTPLSPATGLVNGEDYYADDASGTCGIRQQVIVTIYSAPTGQNFQGVCVDNPSQATIASLIANGNNVQWYTSPSGGTALSPSTILNNNTIYYAGQTNPFTGCKTSRLSVFVTVGVVPVPVGNSSQVFCSNSSPTIADLVASGSNNWYATQSSSIQLDPSTPLVDGQSYFATTIDPPCESTNRLEVVVSILSPNNSGTNGTLSICSDQIASNPTRSLFSALGGTPDTTGTWTGPLPTINGNLGTVNISTLTASGSPYVFIYTVNNGACSPSSSTVTITISDPKNAGTNGTLTTCSNGASQNLFTLLGGSPQSGGTWSPALASGTGIFNPAIDPSGTYTYTISGPAPCGNSTSNVTVTVIPKADAGTNGTLNICSNATPQNLFNSLGGTPQSGGTWSPALASGTGIFNSSVDLAGTYTYTVTGNAPCSNATATVTVTITPNITPTFTAVTPICSGDTLAALPTTSNNGITGSWSPALNNTATTTYTFTPSANQCANPTTLTITVNPKVTPTFTAVTPICSGDTLAALPNTSNNGITGSWSPALNNTTTTTYTFTPSANQCANPTTLTITVNPKVTPTFTTVTPICSGDTLAALPTTSNNGITGSWSPAINNTTTTTYTFTPSANQCANPTTLTITVNPKVTPTFTAVTPICSGDTLVALPTTSNNGIAGSWSPALNNTATTTYTFTPSANQCANPTTLTIVVNPKVTPTFTPVTPICSGDTLAALPTTSNNGITGSWSPALNNTTTTTYTFTPSANQCANPTTLTITVNPLPNAGSNGNLTICSNGSLQDLFTSLGGTPQTGGVWSPALASGTGVFNPSVDAAGVYTYTVTGTAPCGSIAASVTVSITPAPNAGSNGTVTLCANSPSQDLFTSLGGTPQTGGVWSPALASGTGVFNPAVDAAGVYTYTVTGTSPCANGTASATVTVNPLPNAGSNGSLTICSNGSPQDLFTSLGGTPQTGGVWSPVLASGTGIFNPSVDAAGVYTYTVTGTAPCGSIAANVTVSITPAPNAGSNGTVTLCANSPSQDLFTSLGGTPQTGGVWSPALASGTGVFNPAVDAAGVYTYTVTSLCTSKSASVTLTINNCPITDIVIPDGFSPNGDGVNDEFVIENLVTLYPNFSLEIFNRYGSVLYEGNINTPNWNGKSTEKLTIGDGLLPTGVYFYIVNFNDGTKKPLQGRVYLSR